MVSKLFHLWTIYWLKRKVNKGIRLYLNNYTGIKDPEYIKQLLTLHYKTFDSYNDFKFVPLHTNCPKCGALVYLSEAKDDWACSKCNHNKTKEIKEHMLKTNMSEFKCAPYKLDALYKYQFITNGDTIV